MDVRGATGGEPVVRSLFVVNSLCVGGAEKQVVALMNGLTHTPGHHVLLQCLKDDDALRAQLDSAAIANVLPSLHVQSGLSPSAVAGLARRIDDHSIDVIVCTNMYALLYGSLARTLSRRRRDVTLVEVFHTTDVGSRKERLSMLLYSRLVRSVDLMIYVCEAQAAHWRQHGLQARSEMVIHNGIDTTRFEDRWSDATKASLRASFGFPAHCFVVGLCAVMRPEKAHSDLLHALARLRARGVSIHALLIGDGPERQAIESTIDRLHLGVTVRITGLVDDVRPFIAACDAMVLTSHAVETFSIAALESMAMGKPMVMTRIGGAAEQVKEGVDGLLYAPGDIEALSEAFSSLAEPARRSSMGARAAANVRRYFGIDRMVRRYALAIRATALPAERPDNSRDVMPTS